MELNIADVAAGVNILATLSGFAVVAFKAGSLSQKVSSMAASLEEVRDAVFTNPDYVRRARKQRAIRMRRAAKIKGPTKIGHRK